MDGPLLACGRPRAGQAVLPDTRKVRFPKSKHERTARRAGTDRWAVVRRERDRSGRPHRAGKGAQRCVWEEAMR